MPIHLDKFHIPINGSLEVVGHMDYVTAVTSRLAVLEYGVLAFYTGGHSIVLGRDLRRRILQICWATRSATGRVSRFPSFVVFRVRPIMTPSPRSLTEADRDSLLGLLTMIQHTRTRKAYEIEGSYGSDCIRSCCCCCCVLVQDEREIKHREDLSRRNAGPSSGGIVGAYASAPTMTYAPPPR